MSSRWPLQTLSRRQALLLGIGAAVSYVSVFDESLTVLSAQTRPSERYLPGAVIRTLFKDVAPGSFGGSILFHEHLSIDLPQVTPRPAGAAPVQPSPTLNLDLMVDEVKKAQRTGVTCIVDGGHPDMNRNMTNLKEIANRTGMLIVASGGFYMERTYPPSLAGQTDDQIADGLVRDARDQRLGAFGEIGEDPDAAMSPLEEKIFRAVGKAHLRTNLPIFTHNAYGTGPNVPKDAGLRQLDVLESVGVAPSRIAIGHTCCLDDPDADVIKALAKRGAYVGFDRVTAGRVPDDGKVKMLAAFFDAGYADRLLLASDSTGGRTLDAPAYDRTVAGFVPKLKAAGVSDAVIQHVLVDNSRRFLSFVPKNA